MTLNPFRWTFIRRIRIRRLQRELVCLEADRVLLNQVDTAQMDFDAIKASNLRIEQVRKQIRELRT